MADAVLNPAGGLFPTGTAAAVYRPWQKLLGREPSGQPVAFGTVAEDGSLTFTGLLDGQQYTAYAVVDGRPRYIDFGTDLAPEQAGVDLTDINQSIGSIASRVAFLESNPSGEARVDSQPFSQAGGAIIDQSGSWPFYQDSTILRAALTVRAAPLGGPLTVQYMLNSVVFVTLVLEDGASSVDPVDLQVAAPAGSLLSVASTAVGVTAKAESPTAVVFYR
jgi:hypothetical protein